MPPFDYSPLASTAADLLAQFGRAATLRRVTGEAYDPVTGAASGGSTTNTTVSAVLVGISAGYAASLGGNVQAGDMMALIADAQPLASDTLLLGSEQWAVVHVDAVNPGGTALLYKAQVRR